MARWLQARTFIAPRVEPRPQALFPGAALLLLHETLQLLILDRDALGGALLVRGARLRRCLLGELANIVAQNRDAVGDLRIGQGTEVGHAVFLLRAVVRVFKIMARQPRQVC